MIENNTENRKSNVCQNDNNSSFLGLTRESVGDKKIPAFAGMTDGVKRTGMTGERCTHPESGKTMVEMLGVLALMGLLAVLGVKGYEMAMVRVNANRILNEVSRRSVIYSQQMNSTTLSTPLNSSEMASDIEGGYHIDAYRYGTLYFKLDIQNVGGEVCKEVGKLGYNSAIQITANNKALTTSDQSGCTMTGSNTVSFIFNKELAPCPGCLSGVKTCVGQSGCNANQICQNNLCVCAPQYSCGSTCCSAGQNCINGQCTAANACGDGVCETGVCENGACICHSWQDNCPYFCLFTNTSNTTGTCSPNPYLAQGADTNAGGVVWSSRALNWYAAKDFCESDYNGNKSMVTFEELGCVKLDGVQNWDCSNIKSKYQGKGYVWVADQWANDTNAWYVNITSGAVGSIGGASTLPNGIPLIALCH